MAVTEVVLTKDTIGVLKNFSEIHQSIVLKEGDTLKIKSEGDSTFACVTVDENFPIDFNIYDLREFIQAVSLFESPVLMYDSTKPHCVTITNAKKTSRIRYMGADAELITSYVNRDFTFPESDIELELEESQLKSVMSASNVLKLSNVGFQSDGEDVCLVAFDKNEGDGDEANSYSVLLQEGNGDKYLMFIKAENLRLIDGDYDVSIAVGPQFARFKHRTLDLVYYTALDLKSEFAAAEEE